MSNVDVEKIRESGNALHKTEEEIQAEIERQTKPIPVLPPPGIGKIMVFVSVGWYVDPVLTDNSQISEISGAMKIKTDLLIVDHLVIGKHEFETDNLGNLAINLSAGTKFIFKDQFDQVAAWVSSAGEAFFKKIEVLAAEIQKLIVKEQIVLAKDAKISGTSRFNLEDTEVKLKSDKVTDDSLIYITPTTKTDGLVIYVKEKKEGQYFVVGLDQAKELTSFAGHDPEATVSATRPIEFNWLIINQE